MACDHAENENAVRRYVEAHPGCTAREIARHVFGGSGDTRTHERSLAHTYLARLLRSGAVKRTVHASTCSLVAHRWEIADA